MSDRWLPPGEDPRDEIAPATGEKGVLLEYLDRYRMTFELKCAGLEPEQLARRSVPPSTMSLLGLIRHLAQVEHSWSRRLQGREPDDPRPFKKPDDPDWDFNGAVGNEECVNEAWATWRAEVADASEVEVGLDVDATVLVHGEPAEVRDIMVHLVEEYARHVGHADLLRECVDGRTGQ